MNAPANERPAVKPSLYSRPLHVRSSIRPKPRPAAACGRTRLMQFAFSLAEFHKFAQIPPTVCAMEFASWRKQSFASHRFVKTIRRITGIAEQEHRCDAHFKEPACYVDQQPAPEPQPMVAPKDVNFVEFALKSRHATVVRCPFGKSDQLAGLRLDNDTKPATVRVCKCLAPLTLAKFVARPIVVQGVRLIECCYMQRGHCRHVCNFHFPKRKWHVVSNGSPRASPAGRHRSVRIGNVRPKYAYRRWKKEDLAADGRQVTARR